MSVFDAWAKYTIKLLQAESEYAEGLVKHSVLVGDAREFLVRAVLSRILPSAYEIGRGEIVDSHGKRSKQIDLIIARSDSPALGLPNGDKVYLVESVIATIEVKSTLNASKLVEALENCASVGDLRPSAERESYIEAMQNKGYTIKADGTLNHTSDLELQRASIIGYPATYVFGFKGYESKKFKSIADTLVKWSRQRLQKGKITHMRHIPSVIATEGCVAFRNAPPFHKPVDRESPNCLALIGEDHAPLRMLIAHLLYTIQSRIPWVADAHGIKYDPIFYLKGMEPYGYRLSALCQPGGEVAGDKRSASKKSSVKSSKSSR